MGATLNQESRTYRTANKVSLYKWARAFTDGTPINLKNIVDISGEFVDNMDREALL